MKEAPPGYTRIAITDYKPAGQPPVGSVWYQGPGGVATSPCFSEAEAIERAWSLYYRMAAMLRERAA